MSDRKIGMWLYSNGGGDKIQKKIIKKLKERDIEVLNNINLRNAIAKNNLVPLMTVIGTMFAYFSIVIVNFGDFSRFVKNESELKKGNLSLIINLIIRFVIGLTTN